MRDITRNRPFDYFVAAMSSNQSITSGVRAVLQFNTVSYNYMGRYNVVTYTWTPPAGWVLLTLIVGTQGSTGYRQWEIVKNYTGTAWFKLFNMPSVCATWNVAPVRRIDYANGTDTYTATVFPGSNGTVMASGANRFSGICFRF